MLLSLLQKLVTNSYVLPVARRLAKFTHLVAEKTKWANIPSLLTRLGTLVTNLFALLVARQLANLTPLVAEKTKWESIPGFLINNFNFKRRTLLARVGGVGQAD